MYSDRINGTTWDGAFRRMCFGPNDSTVRNSVEGIFYIITCNHLPRQYIMRYMHRDRWHFSTSGCTPRIDNGYVLTEESHRLRDNLDMIIMHHGILTEGRVRDIIEIIMYV